MKGRHLRVDAWFDLICPWCLIGHEHLQAALAQWRARMPEVPVQVHWHSLQLLPEVPAEGWPYRAFYERRLGGAQAVRARQAQVLAAAAPTGAAIDFSRITTFPNTAAAHHLYQRAREHLDGPARERLLRSLFAAYFEHGQNLGDTETLVAIGAAAGLPPETVRAWLGSVAPVAGQAGLSGVPFFVFNQRVARSGAQPAAALLAAMHQACEATALAS